MRETATNANGRPPRPSVKRRALLSAQKLLGALRLGDRYAQLRPADQVIVLMYHSVCGPDAEPWVAPRNRIPVAVFERQMAHLASTGRVVSIDRLIAAATGGERIPPASIVITFDDGYLDNLKVAAPILARFELPAVLYLATGYVADAEPQWADRLHASIEHRRHDRLSLEGLGTWDLASGEERSSASYTIGRWMIEAYRAARIDLQRRIDEQLDPLPCPLKLTMDFDDVRRMRRNYPAFTLGVHTADHIDLSRLLTDHAAAEITRSMSDFRMALGEDAAHFSFPYSRSTPEAIGRLPSLGLRSAMTGEGVVDLHAANMYNLPRLESPESMSLFRYLASGAHPQLTRTLFGRA